MFNVGGLEFAVIAIVALLVFGPTRLPEVSRQVGKALRELRRVQSQVKSEIDDALRIEDPIASPSRSTPRAQLQSRPVVTPGVPDTPPEIGPDGPVERAAADPTPELPGEPPDSSFD